MNNKQRLTGSTSTFLVQLDFGNVGFRSREGKAGVYVPRKKNVSEQRREPHMATMPGFKLGSHWWEMGALTTASSLDPLPLYICIYMYMILPLSFSSFSSSSSSSLHLRKYFPTTSSSESSSRFVSLLYTTRQHLNRIGPRVFSLVAIFGGISIVLHVSFTPGGFTSASPSIFKTNVQMSR